MAILIARLLQVSGRQVKYSFFYGYQGAKPAATMDESFPDVMNYVESH